MPGCRQMAADDLEQQNLLRMKRAKIYVEQTVTTPRRSCSTASSRSPITLADRALNPPRAAPPCVPPADARERVIVSQTPLHQCNCSIPPRVRTSTGKRNPPFPPASSSKHPRAKIHQSRSCPPPSARAQLPTCLNSHQHTTHETCFNPIHPPRTPQLSTRSMLKQAIPSTPPPSPILAPSPNALPTPPPTLPPLPPHHPPHHPTHTTPPPTPNWPW